MLVLMLLMTANAVAAEVTGIGNTLDDLDEAADVVVSGGDISTAEAAAIQQISEYKASPSSYEITDDAAAVISAGTSVIEDGGVTRVEVTDDASAAQGVDLNAYNANVDFDVRDIAEDIADNSGSLGKAEEVFVISGGDAVDVAEAQAIQGLTGYQTGASEYEIEDNAAAIISATDSVLANGNIHVDVTNTVGASDGAMLNSFNADIDFNVADTVVAFDNVLTTTALNTTIGHGIHGQGQ